MLTVYLRLSLTYFFAVYTFLQFPMEQAYLFIVKINIDHFERQWFIILPFRISIYFFGYIGLVDVGMANMSMLKMPLTTFVK